MKPRDTTVYLAELSDAVASRVRPDKPSVYVGQTVLTTDERLEGHLAGRHPPSLSSRGHQSNGEV